MIREVYVGQKDFLSSQIQDATEKSRDGHTVIYLDFYEPTIQMLVEREIVRYPKSECIFFGGHEYCERKMLAISAKGNEPELKDFPIVCLQIEQPNAQMKHQDVLGALMGLGIERAKIGDINIMDDMIQIFTVSNLGEYISDNLIQINRYAVETKIVPISEITAVEPTFSELSIIVPSLRVDALIHSIYKLSRNEASALIKAEKVKVNHQSISKPSAKVKTDDLISVRTKGRFIVGEITGTTKKGNSKLVVKKFT